MKSTVSLGEVRFEPLPPRRRTSTTRSGGVWVDRLLPLVERPDEWARVGAWPTSTASRLKNGKILIPPGRWDFATREMDGEGEHAPKGKAWLYACYLGPESESRGIMEKVRRIG